MATEKKKKKVNRRMDNMILANNNFGVVESYKAIRTNLTFAMAKKGCKKIMICSTMPSEGKSTTVVNLGVAISQNDQRVLIIDCDLRKARTHQFFDLKNSNGVTNVLCNMCEISDAVNSTDYKNLHVMTAGTLPPNPAELLSSDAMPELLNKLEADYDYILIDTPPVNVVSDALIISKYIDGTVLVVRQGQTTHPDVRSALSSFEFANVKILGLILNASVENSGFGSSKYGNKYGNKYSNKYSYSD